MTEVTEIELVTSFLKELGIDAEAAKKAPNIWLLPQQGSDVYMIVVKGFMILQVKIMALPRSNISTFYRKLLELNDNVEESLGAAFGINRNNEIILKMLRPTPNLTLSEFTYYLTSIAHVAAKQTKDLKERFND